jgi:DeoR/GlpR family transcriptional regulator of sugar metabolism
MALSTLERQQRIQQFIARHHQVSVQALCDEFGISLATARRDLEALAEGGQVKRIHGGALVTHDGGTESPVLVRAGEQSDAKSRIGLAAAEMVRDGETIFLSSGTTVLEVALHLRRRSRLNVITNSLLVMNVLAGLSDVTVVSLGGVFNRNEMSFIGHITQQALSEVRADKVFMSISALDLQHGLTNMDLQETLTDRAILKIGREVVLLADHSKIGRAAAAFVAPIAAVHTLITDVAAPARFVEGAKSAGLRVVIA